MALLCGQDRRIRGKGVCNELQGLDWIGKEAKQQKADEGNKKDEQRVLDLS